MYQVEINKLDHQARGIGRINNKIVFVPKSLPGEIVEISISLEKKKFFEGHLNKILNSSSDRIESVCPHFDSCGGCQLLNVSYAKSLEFKQSKVKDVLQKYLPVTVKINDIIKSEDSLYYRNKVTFQVDKEIGFYKEKSNELIPIDTCYIADKKINDIYKIIKDDIDLSNIKQVIIRKTKNTNDTMVIFKTEDYIDDKKIIDSLANFIDSIYINDKLIYGKEKITEVLSGYKFLISPTAFFQVNTSQAEKLYQKALECAEISPDDLVLDLYCGTGTIGILATAYAKKVVGIELNELAIEDAKENKRINNIDNIEFYAGDVGNILQKNSYNPDVVVVDPPRAGLNDLAISQITKIKPKKIVYVSCDIMTLARDLNKLLARYEVVEVTPVDMFPMTSHVESVCVLKLK